MPTGKASATRDTQDGTAQRYLQENERLALIAAIQSYQRERRNEDIDPQTPQFPVCWL
jgi:hypothetical protein